MENTLVKQKRTTCIENDSVRQVILAGVKNTKAVWLAGRVMVWLGAVLNLRSADVAGSNPGRRAAECNPGQVVYTHMLLSPGSIIGTDHWALMLGGWGGNRGPG